MSADRRQVLTGAAAALLAGPAWAAPNTHTLTRRGDRLFLTARIGGVTVEGLLDSAAETSLLSPELAERAGLERGAAVTARGSGAAAMEARLIEHVRLEAAGVRVTDATVAVIDLSDISKRLVGRPVELVLGREIFDAARLAIDIRGGTIRALSAGERARGVKLPLAEHRGIMLTPVSIEGRAPVQAEFDLGNGTRAMISRRYAKAAGLLDERPLTEGAGGGLGGAKRRQSLVLKTLTLAGVTLRDMAVDIEDADDASDANIGVGVLQHFRLTTDFAGKALWLEAV